MTFITFSGYWLLILVALLNGSALFGGLLLGLFGFGRCLAVWIPPYLVDSPSAACPISDVQTEILKKPSHLHYLHRYGLLAVTVGTLALTLVLWLI